LLHRSFAGGTKHGPRRCAPRATASTYDGPVGEGSSISHITLAGGDEVCGIVQQNLPPAGQQPEITTSEAISTSSDESYPVPEDPPPPPMP